MENPRYTISPEAIANGINDLLDEKEELRERIDKAIEYIEECYTQPPNIENFMHEGEMNYLLNILKGSDKE